ncbi:MAG: hypothetical protein J5607_00530 [Clostridiales bacterium]|nr:hypothetical protein [Clostridiales bacterium]
MSEFYDPGRNPGSGKEYFFHDDEFNERAVAELGEASGEAIEPEEENFKFVGTLAKAALISILGTILIFQTALPRKIIIPDQVRAAIGLGTHPHTHTNEWVLDREPTCVEPGLEYTLCTECGERAEEREIAANGHTVPEEWIVERETSCAAPGLEVRRCTVCNEVCESREIPALEHKPKEEWETEKEVTCTDPGKEVIKCEVCGQSVETREIEPAGHKYPNRWTVKEEPTCTKKGTESRKCTVCGEEETRDIDMVDHKFSNWAVREEASCTRKGTEFRKCSVCGKEETRDIAMVDHKFSNWTVREESTCTKKGTEYRKCSVCGKEETRELALKDHTPVTTTTKEPTCTAAGIQTKTCSVCGQLIETTAIPAKGHSFSSWTVKTASTCTVKGVEHRTCSICGAEETRPLDLAAHTPVTVTTKEATCTEAGSQTTTCSVCGAHISTSAIEALGHSWSAWKTVDDDPTRAHPCNDQYRSCTRCGERQTRDAPPSVHSFTYAYNNSGEADAHCSICNYYASQSPGYSITDAGSELDEERGISYSYVIVHTSQGDIKVKNDY